MSLYLKAGRYVEEPQAKHSNRNLVVLLPLQGRNGYVFVLAYVGREHTDATKLFDALEEHIERLASSFGKEANAQHRFEQFLRALNEQLASHVRDGSWNIPIDRMNGLVGIACENQMYLSGTGELTAMFLHRQPAGRYQVYNLSRSIQTEQSLPTWEKPFAVVLDGDLHPGDVFCASNQELQRTLTNDDLLAILTTLPPDGACEKIRQYYPHGTDLTMLVLQAQDVVSPMTQTAQPLSALSVEHLEETEDETTMLLEDQRPRFSAMIAAWAKKRMRGNKKGATEHSVATSRVQKIKKILFKLLRSALKVVGSFFLNLTRRGKKTAVALARKDSREQHIKETQDRVDQSIKKALGRFNRLPSSSKYLAVGAIALVFVFALSISVLSRSKAHSAEVQAYEDQVELAEEKIDAAAGAIIYKDEEQARELYAQAAELVNSLPGDSADRLEIIERLRAEIQTGIDELRRVVNIPEPPRVGDLGEIAQGVVGTAVFEQSGELYVLASDKRVYKVNKETKQVELVQATVGGIGTPIKTASDGETVYFLDDLPGVSFVDFVNANVDTTTLAPGANTRWEDIFLYADKLYLLEPAGGGSDGQITRFTPVFGGFSAGTNWIQSKSTELTNAVSLAVDGTIFVLKRNGQIARFVSGSEVGWDAGPVDPTISQASDIWTDAQSAFVYVLEPAMQRLLVFEKATGAFTLQYRSDAFTGLTDFHVDEEARTIYLLSGTTIFAITPSHL